MKKKLSPKTLFSLAILSLGIFVYHFFTSTISIAIISILYSLILLTAAVHTKISINYRKELTGPEPKFYIGGVFLIGFLFGVTVTYITLTEIFSITF